MFNRTNQSLRTISKAPKGEVQDTLFSPGTPIVFTNRCLLAWSVLTSPVAMYQSTTLFSIIVSVLKWWSARLDVSQTRPSRSSTPAMSTIPIADTSRVRATSRPAVCSWTQRKRMAFKGTECSGGKCNFDRHLQCHVISLPFKDIGTKQMC